MIMTQYILDYYRSNTNSILAIVHVSFKIKAFLKISQYYHIIF
jgi:hypothetical protein